MEKVVGSSQNRHSQTTYLLDPISQSIAPNFQFFEHEFCYTRPHLADILWFMLVV